MESNELVIQVDEDDREVAMVARKVAHDVSNLLLHREGMLLLYANPAHTEFWLQKRSPDKEHFPNKWTLGVTFHVDPEDVTSDDVWGYLTGASREAKEEVGVEIANLEIVIKTTIETAKNRAMVAIMVAEALNDPTPDTVEVSEVKRFNRESVMEVLPDLTPAALVCLKLLGIIEELHE